MRFSNKFTKICLKFFMIYKLAIYNQNFNNNYSYSFGICYMVTNNLSLKIS